MSRVTRILALTAIATAASVAAAQAAPSPAGEHQLPGPVPTTLKVVVKNALPTNPNDGGYGVQGYPRVSLRSGSAACWDPMDIVDYRSPATAAKQALAGGAAVTFRTGVLTGLPLVPSPCKPGLIMLPHYLNWSIVIQEYKDGPWEVARSGPSASWELLGWTISPFPSPADGFLAAIPPSGTTRSTATRTVCVTGTGYLRWPLNSLYTNDTLTVTLSPVCPPAQATPASPGDPATVAPEASTVRIGVTAGTRRPVALGSAGEQWRLESCSGARASAPRALDGGGVVSSSVGRRTPGTGRCVFTTTTSSPNAIVTVEVRARR